MSNILLFTIVIMSLSFVTYAQNKKQSDIVHKIVFQPLRDDTLVHKGLMKQLNNVLTAAPNTKIEVVCHGPGINLLVTDKTTGYAKI